MIIKVGDKVFGPDADLQPVLESLITQPSTSFNNSDLQAYDATNASAENRARFNKYLQNTEKLSSSSISPKRRSELSYNNKKLAGGSDNKHAHPVEQGSFATTDGTGELGTYNVGECVAVCAFDRDSKKGALAHIDNYTKPELNSLFPPGVDKMEVRLAGASTRPGVNTEYSYSNSTKILEAMKNSDKVFDIKSSDLGTLGKNAPSAFIMDKETGQLKNGVPKNFKGYSRENELLYNSKLQATPNAKKDEFNLTQQYTVSKDKKRDLKPILATQETLENLQGKESQFIMDAYGQEKLSYWAANRTATKALRNDMMTEMGLKKSKEPELSALLKHRLETQDKFIGPNSRELNKGMVADKIHYLKEEGLIKEARNSKGQLSYSVDKGKLSKVMEAEKVKLPTFKDKVAKKASKLNRNLEDKKLRVKEKVRDKTQKLSSSIARMKKRFSRTHQPERTTSSQGTGRSPSTTPTSPTRQQESSRGK